MFTLSKLTAAVTVGLMAASSTLAQTCSPQFTEGTPYAIASNINDSYIWLFNGASAGVPSAVHLEVVPPQFSTWFLTSTSDGGWTISIDSPAVTCVTAPAGEDATLTTGSCANAAGTNADFSISCASCTDSEATSCTLVAASSQECVIVPGDSDGDPSIRSLECTGTPEELWNIFAP
ncbi:hypothetical protein BT96DRAFT_1013142 [Gymnopus androsaceus JB14]|uniref:Uncharacterized protein n=1 Tax=Gymnopus androsaceus JB14 TaxID=1447944 RepID=A0A6A4IIC4_9AGAR|nr:hypothetical protein BT96DRAFT_1013142 [Gymnopus androsaceus JB14]